MLIFALIDASAGSSVGNTRRYPSCSFLQSTVLFSNSSSHSSYPFLALEAAEQENPFSEQQVAPDQKFTSDARFAHPDRSILQSRGSLD
jgi:hypothetical protein